MRIRYENLNEISKQLEKFKEMEIAPKKWSPYLLASIAISLAQIADVMVSKAEKEESSGDGKPCTMCPAEGKW